MGRTSVTKVLSGTTTVLRFPPPPGRLPPPKSLIVPATEQMTEDLVRVYLNEIGSYPLLTKVDEADLARCIEAGRDAEAELSTSSDVLTPARKRSLRRAARDGHDAHQRFVTSNLRLVVSIAKAYQSSGMPLLDLIQEGNLGLIHAVDKFDWRKGFKFSTYATWWIRQAIQRGVVAGSRLVRLPAPVRDDALRLQRARLELEARFGREPTIEELAKEALVTVEQVSLLASLPQRAVLPRRAGGRRRRRARRSRRRSAGRQPQRDGHRQPRARRSSIDCCRAWKTANDSCCVSATGSTARPPPRPTSAPSSACPPIGSARSNVRRWPSSAARSRRPSPGHCSTQPDRHTPRTRARRPSLRGGRLGRFGVCPSVSGCAHQRRWLGPGRLTGPEDGQRRDMIRSTYQNMVMSDPNSWTAAPT